MGRVWLMKSSLSSVKLPQREPVRMLRDRATSSARHNNGSSIITVVRDAPAMELFTIGHSNHSIDALIELLQQHGITAVADVRSHPYSRFLPHFNQSALKAGLLREGIQYVFLGRELGARPTDRSCYVDGKASYEKIAATELFAEGIKRILKGSENYKISLMCAEKDPITCHRAILVCQHLRESGLEIKHILNNGDLEYHKHLEDRLLVLHGLSQSKLDNAAPKQLSLFEEIHLEKSPIENYSREDCLKQAYKQQGEQISYIEKKTKPNEDIS